MSVESRVGKLEEEYNEAVDAAYARLLGQLRNEELDALAGPSEPWAGLTDAELEAVGRGLQPPPPGVAEYEPPAWVLRRMWELATPEERRLLGLTEPPEA